MSTYLDLNVALTDEQKALKDQTHKFAEEVLRPASIELDAVADPEDVIKEDSVLWDVFKKAYELGRHTSSLPPEFGGVELSPLEGHIIAEETGWGSADFAIALGVSTMPFGFAATLGSDELKNDVVVPFSQDKEGKYIGCWAITEPDHGSDTLLVGIDSFKDPKVTCQVTARQDGDEWVISGQKSAWVSNGTIATHALTFLTIDASMGMAGGGVAVIPLDLTGVSKGRALNKLGQRALNQGEIFFEEVRIPKHYMIVDQNLYPMVLDAILAGANASMSAIFTGVARAAFEEALAYCKERVQGGKAICEHQSVQQKLFSMFTKVETSRAISRAAMIYNSTAMPPETHYSIAAKVHCTTASFEVASEAIQLFGGYGLSKEYLIEKLFRDARASMIEDGVNEALALTGARLLIDRY